MQVSSASPQQRRCALIGCMTSISEVMNCLGPHRRFLVLVCSVADAHPCGGNMCVETHARVKSNRSIPFRLIPGMGGSQGAHLLHGVVREGHPSRLFRKPIDNAGGADDAALATAAPGKSAEAWGSSTTQPDFHAEIMREEVRPTTVSRRDKTNTRFKPARPRSCPRVYKVAVCPRLIYKLYYVEHQSNNSIPIPFHPVQSHQDIFSLALACIELKSTNC